MSDLHYFPRYSMKENAVTNNSLLLILRLYQYNRYKFEKFMEALGAEEEVSLPSFGLQFNQQKATGKSVLDGYLWQESIKIAVETKLGNDFDLEQLKNHLAVFKEEQHKFLILLNPSSDARSKEQINSLRNLAKRDNIHVLHTTFASIVKAAQDCLSPHDEEMIALVKDYELFCSGCDLLPTDQHTLLVPPCGESVEDNIQFQLYYCPVTRNFRKARYLGIYANKTIQAIGKISKVIPCDINLESNAVEVLDKQSRLTEGEQQRILGASIAAKKYGYDLSTGSKFFLCDEMVRTDFPKKSKGGIQGHRYFDLKEILGDRKIPESLSDLASLLRQHQWK
jgi:hypothetical protein